MKKKLIALLCAVVLMVGLTAPAAAAFDLSGLLGQLSTNSDCETAGLATVLGGGSGLQGLFRDCLPDWLYGTLNERLGDSCDVPAAPCEPSTPVEPEKPVKPEKPAEPGKPVEPPKPADGACSTQAQDVLALVNEHRAANGLAALALSGDLCDVAQRKAQDMKDNRYFSHTSPTYGSPFDMMKHFGITYRSAGENIAMGYSSAASVVDGWMNSAGHRANILNGSYTQMGIGYVASGNYWCQMFIG